MKSHGIRADSLVGFYNSTGDVFHLVHSYGKPRGKQQWRAHCANWWLLWLIQLDWCRVTWVVSPAPSLSPLPPTTCTPPAAISAPAASRLRRRPSVRDADAITQGYARTTTRWLPTEPLPLSAAAWTCSSPGGFKRASDAASDDGSQVT